LRARFNRRGALGAKPGKGEFEAKRQAIFVSAS
jgi:hypothetical protein